MEVLKLGPRRQQTSFTLEAPLFSMEALKIEPGAKLVLTFTKDALYFERVFSAKGKFILHSGAKAQVPAMYGEVSEDLASLILGEDGVDEVSDSEVWHDLSMDYRGSFKRSEIDLIELVKIQGNDYRVAVHTATAKLYVYARQLANAQQWRMVLEQYRDDPKYVQYAAGILYRPG